MLANGRLKRRDLARVFSRLCLSGFGSRLHGVDGFADLRRDFALLGIVSQVGLGTDLSKLAIRAVGRSASEKLVLSALNATDHLHRGRAGLRDRHENGIRREVGRKTSGTSDDVRAFFGQRVESDARLFDSGTQSADVRTSLLLLLVVQRLSLVELDVTLRNLLEGGDRVLVRDESVSEFLQGVVGFASATEKVILDGLLGSRDLSLDLLRRVGLRTRSLSVVDLNLLCDFALKSGDGTFVGSDALGQRFGGRVAGSDFAADFLNFLASTGANSETRDSRDLLISAIFNYSKMDFLLFRTIKFRFKDLHKVDRRTTSFLYFLRGPNGSRGQIFVIDLNANVANYFTNGESRLSDGSD